VYIETKFEAYINVLGLLSSTEAYKTLCDQRQHSGHYNPDVLIFMVLVCIYINAVSCVGVGRPMYGMLLLTWATENISISFSALSLCTPEAEYTNFQIIYPPCCSGVDIGRPTSV
jgi:hypothetical protein